MNKKYVLLTTTIVLIVAIVVSLVAINKYNTTNVAVYDIKEVNLAINKLPNSALIFIAERNGYFNEQGLKINYYGFQTGKLALDSLIGGAADIATTADVPITLAALAEQKISVVATIEYSNDNIQVVARKDSGINKPNDLTGKKIATTKGGGPMFYTHKFLEKYKIDIKDVNIVYLTPADMVTSFIKGDIDAFIVFEPSPYIAIKELSKEKVSVFSDSDIYGETWNIVVRKDYEEKNKNTIKKFIKALVKAEKYLIKNPDESLKIVSESAGIDTETTKEIMKKQKYSVVLNDVLTSYLEQEAEWAIEQGLSSSKEIPNFTDFINKEYLREISPQAVTI